MDRWAEFDWEPEDDEDRRHPSRPLRFLPPGGGMVEITTRTLHGRFLLKPTRECVEIIEGVLGRALATYPRVRLHAYWFLSNHYNLLLSVPDVEAMSAFMRFVNSNLARELGDLFDWHEKFWGRRYRAIVVLDRVAMVRRLRYLLAQGTKEGLVARPEEWPGANSLRALLENEPGVGVWFDRTKEYRARKRGGTPKKYDFAIRYPIPLAPLPCWEGLPDASRRAKVRDLVAEIESRAKAHRRETCHRPLGVHAILAQHPHDHPKNVARSPAPFCHASTRVERVLFVGAYFEFLGAYQDASARLRAGECLGATSRFPPGCFPPRLPFVRRPEAIAQELSS